MYNRVKDQERDAAVDATLNGLTVTPDRYATAAPDRYATVAPDRYAGADRYQAASRYTTASRYLRAKTGPHAATSWPPGEDDLRHYIACWSFDDGLGCRVWVASVTEKGYGYIVIAKKRVLVHRLAFYLEHGYWPNICRHTCDNPPCCEPSHLLDGTRADNAKDMYERGGNWQAKVWKCPQGHPYFGRNLIVTKCGRLCRMCVNDQKRAAARRRANLTEAAWSPAAEGC